SRIVGRGLFAAAPIAEGEIVCVKGGHLLTKAEFANCKGVANEADLQIADDLFLAPVTEAEFEGVMMFLNHSCEPNVGIQGQIVFVAMRDVAAGEELTLDYATIDCDTEPMACRCGAVGCRRVVTGQDWRRPDLRRKYGRDFAWHLLVKMSPEPSADVELAPRNDSGSSQPSPAVRPPARCHVAAGAVPSSYAVRFGHTSTAADITRRSWMRVYPSPDSPESSVPECEHFHQGTYSGG